MAGLIDAILIFIAYLLYPIVTVIFGFFYLMMGSVLYIARSARDCAAPIGGNEPAGQGLHRECLYLECMAVALWSARSVDQCRSSGQHATILSNQGFLGALNGMEGSFLVGLISIVYSIAIAAIPFLAKSIVNGDVGSAARQMIAAATTAVAAGTAAFAGASAGVAAAKASSAGGASGANGALNAASNASSARSNQPATAQAAPPAAPSNSPASQQPSSASSEATATPSVGDNSPAQESNASQSSQSSGGEKSSGAPAGEGAGQPSSAGEKAAAANTSMAASEGAALQRIQESGSEERE